MLSKMSQLNLILPQKSLSDPKDKQWDPPVNSDPLTSEQQTVVKQMLREESSVFARDKDEVGFIKTYKWTLCLLIMPQ